MIALQEELLSFQATAKAEMTATLGKIASLIAAQGGLADGQVANQGSGEAIPPCAPGAKEPPKNA